jgi:hypothetical protein
VGDVDSIKRSDLQTDIQIRKAVLISQTLLHQDQVNLASLVEVPELLCLRGSYSRMTTSKGP